MKPAKKFKTWKDLPTHANRCAKAQGIPENAPVHQMLCVECKKPMWTRDENRENICEGCEWQLKDKIADMQVANRKAATDRLVVPSMGDGSFINPIKSGGGGLF